MDVLAPTSVSCYATAAGLISDVIQGYCLFKNWTVSQSEPTVAQTRRQRLFKNTNLLWAEPVCTPIPQTPPEDDRSTVGPAAVCVRVYKNTRCSLAGIPIIALSPASALFSDCTCSLCACFHTHIVLVCVWVCFVLRVFILKRWCPWTFSMNWLSSLKLIGLRVRVLLYQRLLLDIPPRLFLNIVFFCWRSTENTVNPPIKLDSH